MQLIKRSRHIADRRRVLTGFTDNLQLPIVGLWRRTTIVDEGREDALPRGGCLVSYLRYLGSVKDRYFKEGERRLYGPAQASHDGVLPTSSATHYVLATICNPILSSSKQELLV